MSTATKIDPAEDAVPDGFKPFSNPTEGELFIGPFYIRRNDAGNTVGFRVKPRHLNAAGICHGGILMAFADMQGYAIDVGDYSGAAATVTISTDFLAPVRAGDWVEAVPQIARETRSLIFFQAIMTVRGEAVARCNGIYKKYGGSAPGRNGTET